MPQPIAILISGAPGTGKSTLLTHAPYFFRAHIGETAGLSYDEFYRLFDPLWSTNNREWWRQAVELCLGVAASLLRDHVQVLLIESNGLYTKEDVNTALRVLLPLSSVYHITLDADLDVATARIAQRGDLNLHPPDWVGSWLEHIRSYYEDWTTVIDTSHLTPEQTLEQMYERIRHEEGRLVDLL